MDTLQSLVREDLELSRQNPHRLPVAEAKGPLIQPYLMPSHTRRKYPISLLRNAMVSWFDLSNLEVPYSVAENKVPLLLSTASARVIFLYSSSKTDKQCITDHSLDCSLRLIRQILYE